MTTQTTQPETVAPDVYAAACDALASESSASGTDATPQWLQLLRENAANRYKQLGLPAPKDEEWRYTNLAPLRKTDFTLAPPAAITAADVDALDFPDLGGPRMVFVNGRFDAELSNFDRLPDKLTVASFRQLRESDDTVLKTQLARFADYEYDSFLALNTALIDDGAAIIIPPGESIDEPIHVMSITVAGDQPIMTQPRTLIIAGEQSYAAVIESFHTIGDGPTFTNVVTEISLGQSAHVRHHVVEEENAAAININALRVEQARDSRCSSHTFLFGGKLVRNNCHPTLAGKGAYCLLNGLYLAGDGQHMDNHMRVEHAAAHCDSRQFYKGILNGASRGVFSGRIVVHPDAQKTDAKQSSTNLLLDDRAQIDTKPQLEIYADDVKCTHGATVGQVDDDAVFYLRSRGIPEAEARNLLIFAFAAESLDRLRIEPLRLHLEARVRRCLNQA